MGSICFKSVEVPDNVEDDVVDNSPPLSTDDISNVTAGVYEVVSSHTGDKVALCKAMNISEDTIGEDIVLADIDMTGHGKIRAPLFLGKKTIWHSFHTKHPVRTSHMDMIKTFTITYWDKLEKSLNVEITESREMEEIIKITFSFSGKKARKTMTTIKPSHKRVFPGRARSKIQASFQCQYIWKKPIAKK